MWGLGLHFVCWVLGRRWKTLSGLCPCSYPAACGCPGVGEHLPPAAIAGSPHTKYGLPAPHTGHADQSGPSSLRERQHWAAVETALSCPAARAHRGARPASNDVERIRRGASLTLTYGRVGQSLNLHAREGEAGRERCRPERLPIAWGTKEGARYPVLRRWRSPTSRGQAFLRGMPLGRRVGSPGFSVPP